MKTESIHLTDNEQPLLQFSNRQSRNLFISDFNFEISPQKVRKINVSQKQLMKVCPQTQSLKFIMSQNLLQLQNLNSLKKIFKRSVIVVRACIRLHKFQKKPNLVLKVPLSGKESLIDTVLNETVLSWCRGICKKSLSSIKMPVFDYLKILIAILKQILLRFESLAYYTHPHYLNYELKSFLCSQLYEDYKLYFTHYVSERTKYKIAILDELQDKEAAIISLEIIIFNLTEAIIQDSLSCNFSKLVLISVLQLLFKQYFDEMNCSICHQNCIQGQIKLNNNKFYLTFVNQHSGSLNLIDGVYNDQQIIDLLDFNRCQFGKIQEYFRIAVKHLEKQII